MEDKMKKIVLLALALVFATVTACLGKEIEKAITPQRHTGETKPLDLGQSTPEETNLMDREAKERRDEESGFDEAHVDEDTIEEMAGDDSEARWEFN